MKPPKAVAHTPLMEQYLSVKREHPDALLFFRLGDFYEMFFEDAVRGAALLGLTLTSRNKQDPEPIPMCGIPWHQRDAYLARLLRLGHKVAVCDQLEDPAQAKGLVQRGITEVLTPGSVTGDAFLEASANNFLAALWPGEGSVGICLADASTGEVKLAETAWEEAPGFLSRQRVAEWLVPAARDVEDAASARLDAVLGGLPGARSTATARRFLDLGLPRVRWGASRTELLDALPLAALAAAAALDYLDRVQGGAALQLTQVERWSEEAVLRYDGATARHLELFLPQPGGEPAHTLWRHLNLCVSPLGTRRLRAWLERPLTDFAALTARHDAVEVWFQAGTIRTTFREKLRGFADLERLAARLACGKATPRDLGALRDALGRLPALAAALEGLGRPSDGRDGAVAPPLPGLGGTGRGFAMASDSSEARIAGPPQPPSPLAGIPALEQMLKEALVDEPAPTSREGGIIRPGHDERRDELDALAHSGKRWIAELEATERGRSGIPSLKVGFNRVFGYYLEVTRAHLDKVPADYERRQTLTGAERFVTPALKAREAEVLGAEEKLKALEHELFVAVREKAAAFVPEIQRAADALARFDAETALAEAAARYGWVRPEMDDSDRIRLEAARHPVVERLLPRGAFVPNDCVLDGSARQILLLTGPNMGGKSTYLRQVALIVLLAQSGSFVPATRATIGRVDRLFTRVGAADRLGAGQSTFLVEMSETADILRLATPRSLVLLDEIGRGTATYDGLALAWAVTEHLHAGDGPRPRTIFATHYHELTQLAESLPRLANVHVTVEESGGTVVFLHGIAEGPADRSYGIHVAQLAGLPPALIERAREVLTELESERTVEHLEPPGRRRARIAKPDPNQLPLFGAEPHPMIEELRKLEIEKLSPLEALNRIAQWKAKLRR